MESRNGNGSVVARNVKYDLVLEDVRGLVVYLQLQADAGGEYSGAVKQKSKTKNQR